VTTASTQASIKDLASSFNAETEKVPERHRKILLTAFNDIHIIFLTWDSSKEVLCAIGGVNRDACLGRWRGGSSTAVPGTKWLLWYRGKGSRLASLAWISTIR
jgi:hypothetical protein